MPSHSQPPLTLRHQVAELPDYVLAAWRTRYLIEEGMDLKARAILNQEAAAVRAEGIEPDAKTVWLRLADRVVRQGDAQPELLAATVLAGLATGLRPQGFDKPA